MADLGDVGVVVVSYGSALTLPTTLEALPQQHLAAVIVVDNGSGDHSADVARRLGATVIEQANLGFGAGNNRGNAELTCELVLFLNPDAVLDQANLRALVDYLNDRPRCAVVGPRVLSNGVATYSAGHLTSLAGEIRPLLPAPLSRFGPRRRLPPDYATSGPVGYVEGGCFLVRRDALAEAGGFDEGYFLYFEELELSQRLTRVGWEVHLCAEATVEHAMGASTATTEHGGSPHKVTSTIRYLRRWHGERAARTWARAAQVSWGLRARTGKLHLDESKALQAAATAALSHPAPPPASP